jgi:hypothetical protein
LVEIHSVLVVRFYDMAGVIGDRCDDHEEKSVTRTEMHLSAALASCWHSRMSMLCGGRSTHVSCEACSTVEKIDIKMLRAANV